MEKINFGKFVEIINSHVDGYETAEISDISFHSGESIFYNIAIERNGTVVKNIKIPAHELVLTKEEAIKRHRMMWNWIAYETLKRKERVTKREAIKHFGWFESEMLNECWCCSYARKDGTCEDNCPVQWPGDACYGDLSRGIFGLYIDWVSTDFPTDYKRAAALAHKIANLPEKN